MSKKYIVLFLIVILALCLRLYKLGEFPIPNETDDEYAFFWSGYSLVHLQRPLGWSFQTPYSEEQRAVTYELGQKYNLPTKLEKHPVLGEHPVLLFNDNETIIYDSINEFCKQQNTYRKKFERIANSYKTFKGFYIRYLDK